MEALAFATLTPVTENIVEIIVNEGVEMDTAMVEALHQQLIAFNTSELRLLINKKHAYSYTLEAQLQLGDIPQIKLVAAVCYRKPSEYVTQMLADMPRNHPWNLQIFHDRTTALNWLRSQ